MLMFLYFGIDYSKYCFIGQVPSAVNAKDAFNLSNDEYYSPKQMDNALRPNIGSTVIQVKVL